MGTISICHEDRVRQDVAKVLLTAPDYAWSMSILPKPQQGLDFWLQDEQLLDVYDPHLRRHHRLPRHIYQVLGLCQQQLSLEEARRLLRQALNLGPELTELTLALALDFLQQSRLVLGGPTQGTCD